MCCTAKDKLTQVMASFNGLQYFKLLLIEQVVSVIVTTHAYIQLSACPLPTLIVVELNRKERTTIFVTKGVGRSWGQNWADAWSVGKVRVSVKEVPISFTHIPAKSGKQASRVIGWALARFWSSL